MRRKVLAGIFVIGLVLGIMPISCGIENGDSSIKMPDELPTGQKLVKTGEEIVNQKYIRGLLPHYINCNAYIYSFKPYEPSVVYPEQISITVCAFNSENEAKSELQNLVISNQNTILLSDFVSKHQKELEEYPSYLECDIPDVCIYGRFGHYDVLLFPLGKYVVHIYEVTYTGSIAPHLPEIAEAVYALNAEVAPKEKTPGFDALFAVAGLLAMAYLLRKNRK